MFEVTARIKIREGALDGFKQQAAEIMRQVEESDTKTLRYDWFISDDGTRCEVREGYVDADAVLEHSRHIGDARAKLFEDFAYDHDMTLYAEPSPGLAAAFQALGDKVAYTQYSFFQGLEEKNGVSANRKLLDHYVERYNAGDLDAVMDLYADDAVQLMPDGLYEGWSTIRERLAQELNAFSDVAHRVESFVEQGDAFADEWTFVGTHTGPFSLPDGTEVLPSGKRVAIRGMELVQMRGGKIVVDNLYYDTTAVAAQLGLIPEVASA
jgi:steroid delta-isomerase-like uncharacterized protein